MIRILLSLLLAVSGLSISAAAQSRDVYTVSGISVDESAESVIEAQQKAFASAKIIGARLLLQRLTLADDRAAAALEPMTMETADLLAAAVDVEEEVAGAGRYRGKLAVVFNPRAVRGYLQTNQLAYTDQQAPKAVLIPVSDNQDTYVWGLSWPDESSGRLVPTITSRATNFSRGSSWADIQSEVNLYNLRRAVIAELSGGGGFYRVRLSSVTPSGDREIGVTPAVNTLEAAVNAAQDLMDADWKRASIVRDSDRTLLTASLLYTSLPEWNTLRRALVNSPLVSNVQTRAVSTDGAIVEFAFAGDGSRLRADLRDRGLELSLEDIGWVIKSATLN